MITYWLLSSRKHWRNLWQARLFFVAWSLHVRLSPLTAPPLHVIGATRRSIQPLVPSVGVPLPQKTCFWGWFGPTLFGRAKMLQKLWTFFWIDFHLHLSAMRILRIQHIQLLDPRRNRGPAGHQLRRSPAFPHPWNCHLSFESVYDVCWDIPKTKRLCLCFNI